VILHDRLFDVVTDLNQEEDGEDEDQYEHEISRLAGSDEQWEGEMDRLIERIDFSHRQ